MYCEWFRTPHLCILLECFLGILWSALGGLWGAVEAHGAPQGLVERPAGGAGLRSLYRKLLERFESSWNVLEAMVMEARLRPPSAGQSKWSQIDILLCTVMY